MYLEVGHREAAHDGEAAHSRISFHSFCIITSIDLDFS